MGRKTRVKNDEMLSTTLKMKIKEETVFPIMRTENDKVATSEKDMNGQGSNNEIYSTSINTEFIKKIIFPVIKSNNEIVSTSKDNNEMFSASPFRLKEKRPGHARKLPTNRCSTNRIMGKFQSYIAA